jgi:hypothetical protein
MSIPQPPQPPDPLIRPIGQVIPSRRVPQGEGWRIKDRRPGYVIWARVVDGVERLACVPEGV